MTKKDLPEFVELVKKMREVQKSFDALSLDQELEIDIQGDIVDSLEREVDEYLKKMEEKIDTKSYDLGYADGLRDREKELYDFANAVYWMHEAYKSVEKLRYHADAELRAMAQEKLKREVRNVMTQVNNICEEYEEAQA